MPTLSVVTPSFNQGRFIEATIRSVLSQDVPGLEYVIFDNLSSDQTQDILQAYSPALRWVSEPDHGQAHAVNKGILTTTGEIIGWLNADDIYYPGALLKMLGYFAKNPEVDVIYGMADNISESGVLLDPYPTEPWDIGKLKEVCFLSQPAVFFRRRVVQRFGLLNDRLEYCMDYEYWLRLGLGGAKIVYLTQKLAGSRQYSDTKTISKKVGVHTEINNMMKDILGRVPDRWLYNYAHAVLRQADGLHAKQFFVFKVSIYSIWAGLRWNKKLSYAMLQRTTQWIIAALHTYLRKRFKCA